MKRCVALICHALTSQSMIYDSFVFGVQSWLSFHAPDWTFGLVGRYGSKLASSLLNHTKKLGVFSLDLGVFSKKLGVFFGDLETKNTPNFSESAPNFGDEKLSGWKVLSLAFNNIVLSATHTVPETDHTSRMSVCLRPTLWLRQITIVTHRSARDAHCDGDRTRKSYVGVSASHTVTETDHTSRTSSYPRRTLWRSQNIQVVYRCVCVTHRDGDRSH